MKGQLPKAQRRRVRPRQVLLQTLRETLMCSTESEPRADVRPAAEPAERQAQIQSAQILGLKRFVATLAPCSTNFFLGAWSYNMYMHAAHPPPAPRGAANAPCSDLGPARGRCRKCFALDGLRR